MQPYHRVDPYAEGAQIDWDDAYDMLVGPDGFECLLTEPEDRKWSRDGRKAIERLNEQHARMAVLETIARAALNFYDVCWQLSGSTLELAAVFGPDFVPPEPEVLEKAAHRLRDALLVGGFGRPLEG